jgi:hypothetical protein
MLRESSLKTAKSNTLLRGQIKARHVEIVQSLDARIVEPQFALTALPDGVLRGLILRLMLRLRRNAHLHEEARAE